MTTGPEDPHTTSAETASLGAAGLVRRLERHELSSTEVVEQLLGRIDAVDRAGPRVRSVIETAPDAIEVAAALDAERLAGRTRGPLHGVPVLVKDNVDTVAPLHTTAGSFVFGTGSPGRDAEVVRVLRDAGAIVLGKTNLSQWANFRGRISSSGWSATGGQTRNPHALDRTPGGSSSGSGAAVAARLAPLAVGTETDGSIICPSAACGVAGLKPTVGLVSREGIVPISITQDTAGPMARSVEDLALMLEVLARASEPGAPPVGSAKRPAREETRYLSLLGDGDLRGCRVGVLREGGFGGTHPGTLELFEGLIGLLSSTGAEVVDPLTLGGDGQLVAREDEHVVLLHEYRVAMERYLAARDGGGNGPKTLDDVIAFIRDTPEERADLFGFEHIADAAATGGLENDSYLEALRRNHELARGGLDVLFEQADVVIVPAMPPAWLIDHVIGDLHSGGGWSPPAVAGYPSATLPMGMVGGLPVSFALWGPPYGEATLLRVLFGIEAALGPSVTRPQPAYADSVSIRL